MAKSDKLARLRAARAGQAYSDGEDENIDTEIYDEVDETTYREHKRDRVLNDDFIVDDNGDGYAETGGDDWDQPQNYSDDDGSNSNSKSKPKSKIKMTAAPNITSYFKQPSEAKPSKKEKKNKIAKSDLNDILSDFTSSSTLKRKSPFQTSSVKKSKVEPNTTIDTGDTMFYTANDISNVPPSSPTLGDVDSEPLPHKNLLDGLADDDGMVTGTPMKSAAPQSTINITKQVVSSSDDDDDDDEIVVSRRKRNTVQVDRSIIMTSKKSKPIDSSPIRGSSSPGHTSDVSNVTFEKMDGEDLFNSDDNEGIQMYWFDYAELDTSLLLFGKIKTKEGKLASGVVQVKGMNRHLFVLPRDKKINLYGEEGEEPNEENGYDKPCTPMDAYEELIPLLMDKYGLDTIKAKPEHMRYAFEHFDIPKESDYLKILMPFELPKSQDQPVPDLSGETFSKIFGTTSTIFESFVMQKSVMGPCWLTIKNPDFTTLKNATHCNIELCINDPNDIIVTPNKDKSPSLNVLSINVQPYLNPKNGKQEVGSVAIALYKDLSQEAPIPTDLQPDFETVLVRPIAGSTALPVGLNKLADEQKIQLRGFNNEKILLNCLVGMVKKYDPDVFIGHKLENVTLDILMHRMKELNISQWSNFGRRSRKQFPDKFGKANSRFNLFVIRELCAGRLLCDISNEMGQSLTMKCQSWELPEMYEVVCREKYTPIEVNLSNPAIAQDAQKFLRVAAENAISVKIIGKTAFGMKILSLSRELTNLAGNAWSHTLGGTRAGRNEYILLHEFIKEGYIVPDKESRMKNHNQNNDPQQQNTGDNDNEENNSTNKKSKYIGGLVFEPEKGLHKNYVLVMDFNSLYPSIIQEYNICFTTVERSQLKDDELPKVPTKSGEMGVLPRLLQQLVNRRREVKNKIKVKGISDIEKSQLDVEQMALKVTANSMYGCLGYVNSRFYARPLAMLVTTKGREILLNTRQLAESIGLNVVYGDTDSVMIDTNCDVFNEAIKVGNDFKGQVNQRYKLLEIDIDNVFKRLLLHSKKKYAALNSTMTADGEKLNLEVKGLDMKRREYCPLSKETSEFVLNKILISNDPEEAVNEIYEYLETITKKFEAGEIPMVKLRINTKLSKDPTKYPGGKSMPAVQVALRMQKLGKIVKAGNVMTFVITDYKQEDGASVAERARSLNEVLLTNKTAESNGTEAYKPDKLFYLEKQLMNPIIRLLEKIPGFDIVRLAQVLGLDAHRFESRARAHAHQNELQPLESTIPDVERFRDVDEFKLVCPHCSSAFTFGGLQMSNKYQINFSGLKCKCGELIHPLRISIQLEVFIRSILHKYYHCVLVCDACNLETRQVAVYGKKCIGQHGSASECNGVMHMKFNDKMLYNQLMYLRSIFDVEKGKSRLLKPLNEEDVEGKVMNKGELDALAEQNRQLFDIWAGVVDKFLDVNGRRFVNFGSIFRG